MHTRSQLVVLGLCIALLATCARTQRASSPGTGYFVQKGQRVLMDIDTTRVAIRLRGRSPAFPDSFALRHPLLADRDSIEMFLGRTMALVRLSPAGMRAGLDSVYFELRRDPGVDFAGFVVVLRASSIVRVMSDRLVALFRPEVSHVSRDSLYRVHGLEEVYTTPGRPLRVILRARSRSPIHALRAANSLAELVPPRVEFAHPEFFTRTAQHSQADAPEECHPDQAVALDFDDDHEQDLWYLQRIHAFQAWSLATGAANVPVVAVVDAGINVDDPELALSVLPNPDGRTRNFDCTDCDPLDPRPIDPRDRHGTEVAAIAVARGDNDNAIAGVCPQCTLLPMRAVDVSETVLSSILYEARIQGAWVINLSPTPEEAQVTDDLDDAIDFVATSGRDGKGIVIVVPTPNPEFGPTSVPFDIDGGYLASHEKVVAVTATNDSDTSRPNGSRGDSMDISAPGESIPMLDWDPNTGQPLRNGTSYATPMVAGTAALMLDANPELTAAQVREILTLTADKIDGLSESNPFDPKLGHGRVNAYCAVLRALSAPGP